MSQVGFYHLTRTDAMAALPKLLGRTLEQGQRALVRCRDVAKVDAALWASREPAWLPHGGDDDAHPAMQPIYVTTRDAPAPNGARFLFLLDGAALSPGFDRIFDLFDGQDESAVRAARGRWTEAMAAGHELTYWQQAERGWVKKG